MSHAVHYRDAAGNIHLEDRPSLDAALELVERLQNEDDATQVRVFREVPIEVKTYYRVTAVAADTDAPSSEPVAAPVVESPVATEPVATEPATIEQVEAPVASEPTEVVPPTAPPEPAVAEAHQPAVAEVARLTPVEPPSGATVMSPPPVSPAPAEDAEAHDAEPRGERRQLFSRG